MIELSNMDKVLSSVYLDVVSECLNDRTSAFYKKIEKSNTDVFGKEVIFPCRFGINGGVACSTETSNLPTPGSATLLTFKAPLANVYGNMEISDKLLRVSDKGNNVVNVLNNEVDSLLEAAKFNLKRMLFQTGDGALATLTAAAGTNTVNVNSTRNLTEGMIVDFIVGTSVTASGYRITLVDRVAKTVKLDNVVPSTVTSGAIMTLQGSYKSEIYGLPYIFSTGGSNMYGSSRAIIKYALPGEYTLDHVDPDGIQTVLDNMEEIGGAQPDMILSSYAMRRKYLNAMNTAKLNVETVENDGFKAVAYNGIPIYAEPFVDENEMFFINSSDFSLAQLADWSWVEGSTHEILRPIYGKAAYTATLVKYCNLICRRPKSQAKLTYSED